LPSVWRRHSAKSPLPSAHYLALGKMTLCRVPTHGSRQRLTAVSFGMAADGPLPSATFAESFTLGKRVFAEWGPVSSVQHSVKRLVVESLTLPSVALGKAFFAECPKKGTRQRGWHSTKPRIPVVVASSPDRITQIMVTNCKGVLASSWQKRASINVS
jgi:hypothetical protein